MEICDSQALNEIKETMVKYVTYYYLDHLIFTLSKEKEVLYFKSQLGEVGWGIYSRMPY
jgi:hypothetical protein